MKISVSMIVLNEEKFISRAISSCGFADEIVVVDGGSTDNTLQILQSNSKIKIFHRRWDGHFGHQRQFSLQHCRGDWIVRLDADEAFSLTFEQKIKGLLEASPGDVGAYRIRQCNLVGNERFYSQAFDNFEAYPRIWRNARSVQWQDSIHEKLMGIDGRILNWDVYVVHYGFLDKLAYFKKGQRYSQIPGSQVDTPESLVFRNYNFQPVPARAHVGSHVPPFPPAKKQNQKPGVAIVRGPHLNTWEMKLYAPLQDDYDLTVLTTSMPSPDWTETGMPIVRLPEDKSIHTAMQGVEFALFDADIVLVSPIVWPYTYQAVKTKEKFNQKMVALQWDTTPFAFEEIDTVKRLKACNRNLVDVFIADSNCARDALLIEGVPPDKIVVIPLGIDMATLKTEPSKRGFIRNRLGVSSNEKLLLTQAEPGDKNNIDDLIYAAKLVQTRKGPATDHIKYAVAGRLEDLQFSIDKIEAVGMSKFFIFCPGESLFDLFNGADMLYLSSLPQGSWKGPSHMELKKALAFGLPVIAVARETFPDLVGDAAVLVPQNNPGALCAAIMELSDEFRRIAIGRKARQWAADHFSAEQTIKNLRKLFHSLLRLP